MTPNFTYNSIVRAMPAYNLGIGNEMSDKEYDSMMNLLTNVIEPAQESLGQAISIYCGFVVPALAVVLGIGPDNQLAKGEALAIHCPGKNQELFDVLKQLPFDKLMWEFGDEEDPEWIYVSHSSKNRGKIFTSHLGDTGMVYYKKG